MMNLSSNTENNAHDSNLTANVRGRGMLVMERALKSGPPSAGVNVLDNRRVIPMDLRHTIRESVLHQRSRDLPQLNTGVTGVSVPPKRRRSMHRQAKPFWQTVLSCLAKNLVLLAALIFVGQVIWRWTGRDGRDTNSTLASFDSDSRFADVESSLKETAKMLQDQLDVADKKIGSVIGIITRDFTKKIEEQETIFEKELKDLEARTDKLAKDLEAETDKLVNSVSLLKHNGLVSKGEFEKFWDELNSKGLNVASYNLDTLRAAAKDIVEKEIEKHAADGLGLVDYALASGGARVVKHSEPYVVGKGYSWLGVTIVTNSVHSSAQKMLEPSFGEPGQCFPLQGSNGFVDIRLRTGIIPEAVTLEHVSKSVAYDRSSAPKDCRVSGWYEEGDPATNNIKMMMTLTEFSFDLHRSNAQTFSIPSAGSRIINMVRLSFTSNHGSPALTCIYRFRVHGSEPRHPLAMPDQP